MFCRQVISCDENKAIRLGRYPAVHASTIIGAAGAFSIQSPIQELSLTIAEVCKTTTHFVYLACYRSRSCL